MKKFLSILLAAMMVLATAGVAFAAEVKVSTENTEVINLSEHTFVTYQIFKAKTQTEETEGTVLSDITWGANMADNASNFVTALVAAFDWAWPMTTVDGKDVVDAESITADKVAALLANNKKDAEMFARIVDAYKSGEPAELAADTTTQLESGYYLIVDTTTPADGVVYNASLLYVSSPQITITVKTDKPSQDKKVKENETTKVGENSDGWNEVADYCIGDTVPFKLTSKVPNLKYFTHYEMTFHDKMSDGLTLVYDENNVPAVKVTIGGVELGDSEYSVTTDIQNTDTTADDYCEHDCTFHVTINELVGKDYAENDPIVVEFSAVLNEKANLGNVGNENTSILEFSNNPNVEDSTTETPEEKVVVFTYELDVTKVDGETKEPLADAEFVLQNAAGKYATFTWSTEHNENGCYVVTGWTADMTDDCKLVSAQTDGKFRIHGLDDGEYTLIETVAPAGYNTADAMKIDIVAGTEHDENYNGTAAEYLESLSIVINGETANGAVNTGTVATTVANYHGATLPSTGGIGTTLFYLFGGLMAAGSALTLVIRRRADADEE